MAAIRNSSLIKRFTDFLRLKTGDMLDGEITPLIVPTINQPVPLRITQIIDVALNDSDKTLTVPSGKQWRVLYGFVQLTTTATTGNRRIEVAFRDENDNVVYRVLGFNVQIASTTEEYIIGQFGDLAESLTTVHTLPTPINAFLKENFSIRVFDNAAIAAAADDLTIRLIIEEIDTTGEGI